MKNRELNRPHPSPLPNPLRFPHPQPLSHPMGEGSQEREFRSPRFDKTDVASGRMVSAAQRTGADEGRDATECSKGTRAVSLSLGLPLRTIPCAFRSIPTGLCHLAQGWRVARLPWVAWAMDIQPQRGCSPACVRASTLSGLMEFCGLAQGSSCLATLGWRTQSLWDCPNIGPNLCAMVSSLGERAGVRAGVPLISKPFFTFNFSLPLQA